MIPFTAGMATYQTSDTRAGCPVKAKKNRPLLTKTFTVSTTSLIMATGHMIRSAAGRADLRLFTGFVTSDGGGCVWGGGFSLIGAHERGRPCFL